MDTLCNENFKVVFLQNNNEIVANFYDNEKECNNKENQCIIEENIKTDILFLTEINNARLYMDGLETLPELQVKEDDNGEVYLSPSSVLVNLFKKDYYPLIPGRYRIKIKIDERYYYSLIKVIPKLISEEECEVIREDLEKEIKGLAFQLIRKNMGVGDCYNLDMAPIDIYRFFIIKKNFSYIMAAIMDLSIKANHKICTEYKIVQHEKVTQIDNVTMKGYLSNSVKEHFFKVPIKKLNYNLPENQWIKKILREVTFILEKFINSSKIFINYQESLIDKNIKYTYQESTKLVIKEQKNVIKYTNELIELALKMKNSINILKTTDCFNSINNSKVTFIPHTLFSDPRYNCLYRLYKQLQNDEFNIELDNQYTFQWKRTDKLYEMWCYIKICKILSNNNLGFNIEEGWVFDDYNEDANVLIPELVSGTTVIFTKNNLTLKLVYDKEVPFSSKETNLNDNPMYMTSVNNVPDCRLDIYKDGIYIRTIIFEVKYRPKQYIWNSSLTKNNKSATMKQLVSYAQNFKSIYLFGGKKIYHNLNPTYKVFILHPKDINEQRIEDDFVDHNLRFLVMRPGIGEKTLEKNIQEAISNICLEYQDYTGI